MYTYTEEGISMHILLYKCKALVMSLDISLRSANVEILEKNPDYKISVIEQFRARPSGFRKVMGIPGQLRSYRVAIDDRERCVAGFHVDVVLGEIAIVHALGMHSWRYEFDPDDIEPVHITKTVSSIDSIPYEFPRPVHDKMIHAEIVKRHDERKLQRVPSDTD
jgi:hypothetical protein